MARTMAAAITEETAALPRVPRCMTRARVAAAMTAAVIRADRAEMTATAIKVDRVEMATADRAVATMMAMVPSSKWDRSASTYASSRRYRSLRTLQRAATHSR